MYHLNSIHEQRNSYTRGGGLIISFINNLRKATQSYKNPISQKKKHFNKVTKGTETTIKVKEYNTRVLSQITSKLIY